MHLFRKAIPPIEAPAPAPAESQPDDPIGSVVAEERAAFRVRETSSVCARLDLEQRTWQKRRNAAYADFCAALEQHRIAKEQLNGKTGIN